MDKGKRVVCIILNGSMKGDWNGECTFLGARDNTVIDYVIVNEEGSDRKSRRV